MAEKILIIDDDVDTLRLVGLMLQRQGYHISAASNGSQGLAKALEERPDLILLDVMMPDMDGYEVTRRLRKNPATVSIPILMFTAKTQLDDKVTGFEVGADDYLTKPFSMRELVARVKAQLRRGRLLREEMGKSVEETPHETLTFDNLTINLTRREVTLNANPLQLKPKEYELLLFLAEHRRQMLSREFILERVWGWDYIGDSRTVDVHVRWLRQKIEENSSEPKRIVTVRGGGYRFEG